MDSDAGSREVRRSGGIPPAPEVDRSSDRIGRFYGGILLERWNGAKYRFENARRQRKQEEREKEAAMKILVTGATGFIGSHLTRQLEAGGHKVLAVSRRAGADYDWSEEGLARGVREADAIVNLAGESLIGKRWSPRQKQLLRSSRIDNTRRLAALAAARKPAAFVSASAIGYYGASTDAVFNESKNKGEGFLADLCADWELA